MINKSNVQCLGGYCMAELGTWPSASIFQHGNVFIHAQTPSAQIETSNRYGTRQKQVHMFHKAIPSTRRRRGVILIPLCNLPACDVGGRNLPAPEQPQWALSRIPAAVPRKALWDALIPPQIPIPLPRLCLYNLAEAGTRFRSSDWEDGGGWAQRGWAGSWNG